jgi:hypothetical protein
MIKDVISYSTDIAVHFHSINQSKTRIQLSQKISSNNAVKFVTFFFNKCGLLTKLEATVCQWNSFAKQRGIFAASRPPTNEKEVNILYLLEGTRAMMTLNGAHAIILLCETVASFLALGSDNLCFDPANFDDPLSNYFTALP